MEQKDYRLAAIMYTDIAGFSRMMEADDQGTLELLAYHNDLIKGIVESHHGSVIKTIGDAVLVDFKNTVEALGSAMAIQDALYAHNRENPGSPLLVRIGLHLGDIYFFENDALGEGINIAARLQALAKPGCICFSQDVYNLVLNKIEFHAEKLGKVSLKNIAKEIHAYEIATPNAEFDPDRDKPRQGYRPSSYLGEESGGDEGSATSSRGASAVPRTAAAQAGEASGRSFSAEGSRDLLAQIRGAILQDTKAMGRRMTIDEARSRYGSYGVEADEVIAAMAEQGLVARRGRGLQGGDGSSASGFGRNARGEFDRDELKADIEATVQGIVGGIERASERYLSEDERERYRERYRRHIERARDRAERHRDRCEIRAERDQLRGGGSGPEDRARDFETYRRKLEDGERRALGGFIGNLASFVAVNAGLWLMNLSFAGPSFHWAAIVTAAWGIGLASTAVGAARARAKSREAGKMPELDAEGLSGYKRLNRLRDSLAQHASSTATVPILLAVINYLTSPGFPWFLIPTAAMAVGFFSHLATYGSSRRRLERGILEALGIRGGWSKIFAAEAQAAGAANLGDYAGLYREAEAAKAGIASLLASAQPGTVDAQLLPSLDQYLEQVRLLAQSANEIDRLVEGIPVAALAGDREALEAKEAGASEALKAEYRKSIEEIAKQEESYGELKEQSEVVGLRLRSSVNQLKQMRLDIARLQAAPGEAGSGGLEGLKRRTDELSRYLEDLRSGYSESKEDPFAELERAERERLEAGKPPDAEGEIEGPKG